MAEVIKLTFDLFGTLGNHAIENTLRGILENELLWREFLTACGWSLDKEENGIETDIGENELLELYEALCTKTFHAWAGEQSQQFKENFMDCKVKNTTKITFCEELNVLTTKGKGKKFTTGREGRFLR